jgi:hypothetical protein
MSCTGDRSSLLVLNFPGKVSLCLTLDEVKNIVNDVGGINKLYMLDKLRIHTELSSDIDENFKLTWMHKSKIGQFLENNGNLKKEIHKDEKLDFDELSNFFKI